MNFDFRQMSFFLSRHRHLAALAVGGFILVYILIFLLEGGGSSSLPEEWKPNGLPTLAAVGELPPLHEAMEKNAALKARVENFTAYDEAFLFVNYAKIDSDIALILLLWSGADLNKTGKTSEGVDRRVDFFLRKIYGLGPYEPLVGDPLLGKRPWVRWLAHFKSRLLLQAAGQKIYDGGVYYNYKKDEIHVEGKLSKEFFDGFIGFLKEQPKPLPYINNLLVFIDETKGLKNLDKKEKKLLQKLQSLR